MGGFPFPVEGGDERMQYFASNGTTFPTPIRRQILLGRFSFRDCCKNQYLKVETWAEEMVIYHEESKYVIWSSYPAKLPFLPNTILHLLH